MKGQYTRPGSYMPMAVAIKSLKGMINVLIPIPNFVYDEGFVIPKSVGSFCLFVLCYLLA